MKSALVGFLATLYVISVFPSPGLAQQDSEEIQIEARYQDWMHVVYEDPFGENSAEGAVEGNVDSGSKRLSYVCYNNGNEALLVQTSEFLGITMEDRETREVKWVVNGGAVRTYDWWLTDSGISGSTLGLASTVHASALRTFVKDAHSGSTVHFRISDHEGHSHDLQFSLSGFTNAYEAACDQS